MSPTAADALPDPAVAFARAAVARHLATKEQAGECVRIAHDSQRRGKPLAIDEVFVKKGYLRRPEAQSLARALAAQAVRPAPPVRGAPALDLAPEPGATPGRAARRKCPSCEKDPGHAADECERCGADLVTGGPGPHATICTSCTRVVKKGTAICPRCATPLGRERGRVRATGSTAGGLVAWLDRLVLVLALAGGFYVLVYRHMIAPPAPPPAEEEAAAPDPAQAARDALGRGDVGAAANALADAVKAPGHDPELDVAYAVACRKAGRTSDGREALERARKARPDDPRLAVLAAQTALDGGDAGAALAILQGVAEPARDDDWLRARLRLADAQRDDAPVEELLAKIKVRTPAEGRRLAEAALFRGTTAFDAGNLEGACRELAKAVELAPGYAPALERLGVAYLRSRQTGLARPLFEKACAAAPSEPAPRLGLAMALDQLGEKDGAARAYREALRLMGDDPRFAREAGLAKARLAALEAR